jgi:hypothetical protein
MFAGFLQLLQWSKIGEGAGSQFLPDLLPVILLKVINQPELGLCIDRPINLPGQFQGSPGRTGEACHSFQ